MLVSFLGAKLSETQPWSQPTPLRQEPATPEFPTHALPDIIRSYVEGLATQTQTPPDMAASVVLGILASTVAGRIDIEAGPGWNEPLCLYTVTAMDPGSRKTAVFSAASAPLVALEKELAKEAAPNITLAKAERSFKETAAAALLRSREPNAAEQYAQAMLELEAVEVPVAPRIFAEDATPEAIAVLAAEQGGRMTLASDEGGIFDIFAGRYSNGQANMEVLLKGHTGASYTVDRVGREPKLIESLTLTFALAVQPAVLRKIGETTEKKSRGELERFLYSVPESNVGNRLISPPRMRVQVKDDYAKVITRLFRRAAQPDGRFTLQLSEDGAAEFYRIQQKNEDRLKQGGMLGDPRVRGWGSKLSGAVARIAGLLHLANDLRDQPVSAGAFRAAEVIGDYYAQHALAAFSLMDSRTDNAKADHLRNAIDNHELAEFSQKELFDVLSRGRWPKSSYLTEPLSVLVDYGWIREVPQEEPRGAGRPKSPRFQANPIAFPWVQRQGLADSADIAETPIRVFDAGESAAAVPCMFCPKPSVNGYACAECQEEVGQTNVG